MKALKEGSQNARILGYLAHGHTLTALEALEWFGCFRLAARVKQLRDRGHDIACEMVTREEKTFARYSLRNAVHVSQLRAA
jgi:hypothetical protein